MQSGSSRISKATLWLVQTSALSGQEEHVPPLPPRPAMAPQPTLTGLLGRLLSRLWCVLVALPALAAAQCLTSSRKQDCQSDMF